MAQDRDTDTPSRLILRRDRAQLAALETWVHDLAAARGLSRRTVFNLDLVLTEAVTNVIDHAGHSDQNGDIELSCSLNDGRIEVAISDDGPPFDPTARAPVVAPRSLEEAEPGGLGVHLMRRYTTHMDYARVDGRNVLRMTLPAEFAPPAG